MTTKVTLSSSANTVQPAVVGPAPTGTAATDRNNLIQAIGDTPAGGRLWLPTSASTFYTIDQALSITKSISIEGDAALPTFESVSLGGSAIAPVTPFLSGAVIKQVTAGLDILDLSGSAISVNLRRLGLLFASGLGSTGHGVNGSPSATVGSGHTMGLTDFKWEDVHVYGHDGNHHAFRLLNPQLGTIVHCRSYGGGGFSVIADAGEINAGNIVFIHPYVAMLNAGTAGGFTHSSAGGTPGTLNLLTYIRPQVIQNSTVANASTNPMWNDKAGVADPTHVTVVAADFETASGSAASLFVPGSGTTFVGDYLINGGNTGNTRYGVSAMPNWQSNTGSGNTGIGNLALAALTTTGANNTGLGGSALTTLTTGSHNAGIGALSLHLLTTGQDNVGVGENSGGAVTTGNNNTFLGHNSGVTNTGANATTTGNQNVYIGAFAGAGAADGSLSNQTVIGYTAKASGGSSTAIGEATNAGAAGSVAIGRDNASSAATATVANQFVLGTALHQVQILNNTTGSGSAALGANCPAVTATAPFTWFKMMSGDGSTVYVPAWK